MISLQAGNNKGETGGLFDTKIDQTIQVEQEISIQLTDIQLTAIDLYERGFNTFPLPNAHDWVLRKDKNGKVTKHPYPIKMQRVYYSRLHLDSTFVSLFERSNIGVMCGRTSGNLVHIDCETIESYRYIGKELSKRSVPFWTYTSSRGGGYWLRLIEGEARNIVKAKCKIKDVEVWGNCHFAVAPPSMHPSGDQYMWQMPEPRVSISRYQTIPAVSVDLLEWLGVTIKKETSSFTPKELINNLPKWAENISRPNVEVWLNGAVEGGRNSKLASLAYDLAGNKISKREALEILYEVADRCIPPFPKKDAKSIVNSAYKEERTSARSYFGKSVIRPKTWQAAEIFVNEFDWNSMKWIYEDKVRGKSTMKSSTVKTVFLALIERAKLDGRSTFRATTREVSVIASINRKTVGHAYQALQNAKFIKLKDTGSKTDKTSLFSFQDYSRLSPLTITCIYSGDKLEYSKLPKTNAEKDVFGATHGYEIWKHLLVYPEKNPYRTAKALKLSASVVYAAFQRLQSLGLITYNQSEDLWYGEIKTDASLEFLAMGMNKNGRSQKREEKYILERQLYLNKQFVKAKKYYVEETLRIRMEKEIK